MHKVERAGRQDKGRLVINHAKTALTITFLIGLLSQGNNLSTRVLAEEEAPLVTTVHDSIGPMGMGRPQLLDKDHRQIDYVSAGQQSVVRLSVTNNQDFEQTFIVLVEIRNGKGVTEHVAWERGLVESGGRHYSEVVWVPESGCLDESSCTPDHEIRAFVITDFEEPRVLTEVKTLTGITVRDQEYHGISYSLYRVDIDGTLYPVQYHFDNGAIRQITASYGSGAFFVRLENVSSDTELVIVLPTNLMDLVFIPWLSHDPAVKPNYTPEFMLDTLFVEPVSVQEKADRTKWVIPIGEGSEELEIFVSGPI